MASRESLTLLHYCERSCFFVAAFESRFGEGVIVVIDILSSFPRSDLPVVLQFRHKYLRNSLSPFDWEKVGVCPGAKPLALSFYRL